MRQVHFDLLRQLEDGRRRSHGTRCRRRHRGFAVRRSVARRQRNVNPVSVACGRRWDRWFCRACTSRRAGWAVPMARSSVLIDG